MENFDSGTPPAAVAHPPKTSHTLKYAVIGGLAVIVLGFILKMAGMSNNQGSGIISRIFSVVIITAAVLLSIKNYNANREGARYPFGEAFGTGAITGLFLSLIIGVFTFLNYTVIDPDSLDQLQQATATAMEQQDIPSDQEEQMESMMGMMTSPAAIAIMIVIMNVIWTLIVSLIGAAIFKRD